MGSWSLGSMVDKIQGYDKVMSDFGYDQAGVGSKAWSQLFENLDNETRIELRSSEWEYCTGREVHTGHTPAELRELLLNQLDRDQLIKLNLEMNNA